MGVGQRQSFQKYPVDQPENPVDRAGGPVLPNARRGFCFGIALRYRYKRYFHKEPRVTTQFSLLQRDQGT